jgi:hypothetical protein
MLNNSEVQPETLTQRQILAVRCPMCRALPKERCTLSTGHPSAKTHIARSVAAAKASPPENSVQAILRILKNGVSRLFQHK